MGEAFEPDPPLAESPVSDWDSDDLPSPSPTPSLAEDNSDTPPTMTLPPSILVRLQVALLPNYVLIPPLDEPLPPQHLHPITDILLEFTPLTKGNWDRQLLRSFHDTPSPFLSPVLEFFQKVQAQLDQVYQFSETEATEQPRWTVKKEFANETAFQGGGHDDYGKDILLYRYEAQFSVRPSCHPWFLTTGEEGPRHVTPWPVMNLFGRCPDFQRSTRYLEARYPTPAHPKEDPSGRDPQSNNTAAQDLLDVLVTIFGGYFVLRVTQLAYRLLWKGGSL